MHDGPPPPAPDDPASEPQPRRRLSRWLLPLAGILFVAPAGNPLPDREPGGVPSRLLDRPNLVVLVADDQRADMLGVVHPILKTPRLDELARRGVRFRNAYVTTSICAVSRASLFSGQYARRHGIHDFATPFSEAALAQTYPALLRRAGYFTGFIGKYGVGNEMPSASFDVWHGFGGQGSYFAQDSAGNPIHLTRLIARQATDFLTRAAPRQQPFLLAISFKAPHVEGLNEFAHNPDFDDLYEGEDISYPADTSYTRLEPPSLFSGNPGEEARARWRVRFGSDSLYQANVKRYYRLVNGIDETVGVILDTLERLGLAGNTVILYTSDNGFFLGEHGLAGKWYGLDESIRVPMVVFDPRVPPAGRGAVRDEMVLNIDVAPTLLSLAGLQAPDAMQGRDLRPLVEDPSPPATWRSHFFYEHLFDYGGRIPRSEGVVGKRYTYLRYLDLEPAFEVLYDHEVDPDETRNLARFPALTDTLDTLRARWAAYRVALE